MFRTTLLTTLALLASIATAQMHFTAAEFTDHIAGELNALVVDCDTHSYAIATDTWAMTPACFFSGSGSEHTRWMIDRYVEGISDIRYYGGWRVESGVITRLAELNSGQGVGFILQDIDDDRDTLVMVNVQDEDGEW